MKLRALTICLPLAALSLSGCVDPYAAPNQNTKSGAITGAMIGGLYGATRKGDDKLLKSIVGAGIGAAVGGAIGQTLDAQAADLRRQIGNPNVGIENTGSQLIVTMPQDILFATDSAALRPDLSRDLEAVATNLQRYPSSTVQVLGHTDNTGSASYNRDLSQRRAASVAAVLVRNGVRPDRVATYGMGEDQPVASNLTVDGRAMNRRVEIIIRPTN